VRWVSPGTTNQLPMEALMNKAIKTVLTLTAMLAAGCSEGTVAPRSQSSEANISGGGSSAALTSTDTLRFTFVIDPSRTLTYSVGQGNTITFPAGSLCDPVTSSYGMGKWDSACPVATSPITVNTKAWLDAKGQAHVDFDKHVRFVPSSNPAAWVMLSITDMGTATLPWTNILYCVNGNHACIDESKSDPSVATYRTSTGKLVRRIKHFSGYSIINGEACDPSPDNPDCIGDGGDMSRASAGARVSSNASVNALLRDHPLPDHPSKSELIGPLGGTLRLPQAGVTLIVPPGAVSAPTQFSITHVGGRFMAYNFEPHGAKFNVPLVLIQDLRGSNHKAGASLIGAYFANESQLDQARGTAVANELLNVTLNNSLNQATMLISHFSGYMWASGRDE
jgi:hypothetical protein